MTIERNVKGLLGTKLGMTQLWDENNRIVPVTVIAAGTNVVTQVRTPEKDGYNAIQVGFGEIDGRKVNKPRAGHFQTAGTTPRRHLVEIRTTTAGEFTVGQELPVDTFAAGDEIDVTGTSKGKGFAGVMKRHGFHGVSSSHGAHTQPPQAGLDRRLRDPRSRLQGRPDGRPDGLGHRHHPEPHGARRGRRQGPDPREGRHPGPQGWPRRAPLGRQDCTDYWRGGLSMPTQTTSKRASTKGAASKVDLPAEIFDVEVNIPLIHQVVVAQQAAARQGSHSTKTPRRGPRRWPQALQAEGHRPRPPGLDPRSAVRRRWRRARPAAAQLRPAHAQEDEGRRAPRCPLRPGPRRPHPRRRRLRPGRRSVHQDRARLAHRDQRPAPLPRRARAHRRRHLALAAQRARGAHRGRRPAQHLRRGRLRRRGLHPGRLRRLRERHRRHERAQGRAEPRRGARAQGRGRVRGRGRGQGRGEGGREEGRQEGQRPEEGRREARPRNAESRTSPAPSRRTRTARVPRATRSRATPSR